MFLVLKSKDIDVKDITNCLNNTWQVHRNLLFITRNENTSSPAASAFRDYLLFRREGAGR